LDVATGKEARSLKAGPYVRSLAFSPDGRQLATTGSRLCLWDVATSQMLREFKGHSIGVSSVAFSPDGRTLLSGGFDAAMRLWDVASGKETRQFRHPSRKKYPLPVEAVGYLPGGERLVSRALGGVRVWEVSTGKVLRTFMSGHSDDACGPMAVSPDGRVLALEVEESSFATVRLWDVASGKELHRLGKREDRGFAHAGLSFAFSPDGKFLA